MQGDHHGDHHIVIVDGLTVRHQHLVSALRSAKGVSVQSRSLDELVENKPDQEEDAGLIDVIVLLGDGDTPHQDMTAKIRAAGLTQPLLVLGPETGTTDDEADEMIRLPVQIGFLIAGGDARIDVLGLFCLNAQNSVYFALRNSAVVVLEPDAPELSLSVPPSQRRSVDLKDPCRISDRVQPLQGLGASVA